MQTGALIALVRGVTPPFLASISVGKITPGRVAISAPICLTTSREFLSLMNHLLIQMLGESGSVEIEASGHSALYDRMIGSRADRIVHLAPYPVLIVR